jgi:hypothetical protein
MKKILILISICTSMLLISCNKNNMETSFDLIPVKFNKSYQYIGQDGKILISNGFQNATLFRNGLALVQTEGNDGKWGYINQKGTYDIAPIYKTATVFSEEIAWVVQEKSYPTAINKDGKTIFSIENAESVKNFHCGLAAFSINDSTSLKWGFLDKSGKIKIKNIYNNVDNFYEDKCAVANADGKWGFIDKEGNLIINYQFDIVDHFENGHAAVNSNGKYGIIDEKGKFIINPIYDQITLDGDLFIVYQNEKYGWINKDGKYIINPQFTISDKFNNTMLAPIKTGDKYGYIDKDGKYAITPQFDNAFSYINKIAFVYTNNKYGIIDNKGKFILNPQINEIAFDIYNTLNSKVSAYDEVSSDYFNLNDITNKINYTTPDNLSVFSTFNDVLKQYNKTFNFDMYNKIYDIKTWETINSGSNYRYILLGSPYVNEFNGQYNEMRYNTNAQIDGFAFVFNFFGKGEGKQKDVKDAIEKTLNNFILDTRMSNGILNIYRNGSIAIAILIDNGSLIVITSKNNIIDQYIRGYASYNSTVDTAYPAVDTTAAPALPDKAEIQEETTPIFRGK